MPDDINPEASHWIGDHEIKEDKYIGALVVPYVKEIDKKLKSFGSLLTSRRPLLDKTLKNGQPTQFLVKRVVKKFIFDKPSDETKLVLMNIW